MEAPEVPLEQLHEDMHHHAHGAKEGWISGVALSAALLAACAAVTAMLAGHHANEAMLEQIKASDTWAFYQAKSIKSMVLQTKIDVLTAMDKKPSAEEIAKAKEYKDEQKELSEKAKELDESSHKHLATHVKFSYGITLLQVAIAVSAISALTKKSSFWFVGLAFGCGGIGYLIYGLVS